jgi:hypothetical protein
MFNDKLLKTNLKFCYSCKEYYSTKLCKNCCEIYYNSFRGCQYMNTLMMKNNVPCYLYARVLFLFSQIQNVFPVIHLYNYKYILVKILEYIGEYTVAYSIKYVFKNEKLWHDICVKLLCLGITFIV